jgi:VIT1/CCC1 family predicted Fe2+/Mn2+ transporter
MSALSGFPHRGGHTERRVSRIVSESFWTAVALTLGLVAFFLVAGGSAAMTAPVIVSALVLFVLWALHARSVRRHAVEVHRDERWRHARERRGF